ncbi:CgeB family protein [Roseimicrobium gellanilyticum]|nr:glycosyltransferase [Roseimicrobium gellanilyticum]
MRIYSAVRHSSDPSLFYGSLWTGNFHPALRQLGHEVIESSVDLLPASQFMGASRKLDREETEIRANITQQILDDLRRAHAAAPIDLFLSYFYNSHFDPAGFAEIRRMGIPSVNFYCNSICQFDLVADVAAKADFAWHAEKNAKALYQRVGATPIWVQMGADPEVYRPVTDVSRKADACFVGMRYADRHRWMAALIRAEIPVEIYGPGWGAPVAQQSPPPPQDGEAPKKRHHVKPRQLSSYLTLVTKHMQRYGIVGGLSRIWKQYAQREEDRQVLPLFTPYAKGSIPFDKVCEVFSEHEVILNFSNVWADDQPGSELIPHVRLRDFEAPMCRTCYLTGYTDEITEFYEVGREIDTYSSEAELVEKTRYYLENPEAAERLREAGWQRARRDHTWARRFEELFRKTGLGIS